MPDRDEPRRPLRVALVGHGFMGSAHSQAWRTVARAFDVPATPQLAVLCGRRADAAREAAVKWGWSEAATDWREVVERPDVDVVDICTPPSSHEQIASAALASGKHVLCEKPLANSAAAARRLVQAADEASRNGVFAMLGFNYRRVPALAFARQLVADGRVGAMRHLRAGYLQDWLASPGAPLSWRLRREDAGSGALGDLGSHLIDLACFLTGQRVASVCASTETFVTHRPSPTGDHRLEPVTVDDAAFLEARLSGGALATFEVSRLATGRKNHLRVEINGELGSVVFDLERLNELEFYDATLPAGERGFRRILMTEPDHPYLAAWWPPGHVLGWEHTFTHQAADFLQAIAAGQQPHPSFADGLHVQQVIEAALQSAAAGTWQPVPDADNARADSAVGHGQPEPAFSDRRQRS
jgi:predicted dehydrogenase